MKNPASVLPGAAEAIQGVVAVTMKAGIPHETLELVHQRASQINGCSFCVEMGARGAKKAGETDERLWLVGAWRDAVCYTEAERAALALAESMTRLADRERADAVPDDVWAEVTKHFDEQAVAGLILWIATTNLFNRLNTAIRQPPGGSWN
jgi:AhpD family alkylhydroperoxidase